MLPLLLIDLVLKGHLCALILNLIIVFDVLRLCGLYSLQNRLILNLSSFIQEILEASLFTEAILLIVYRLRYHRLRYLDNFLRIKSLVLEEINRVTLILAALIFDPVRDQRCWRKRHHHFMRAVIHQFCHRRYI